MLNQERCSITKLLVVIFVLLQLCAVLYYAGIYGKINANFPRFQFSMLVSRYEPIQNKSRVHDHVLEELMKNPIYSKFGIKPAKSRKRVTLLIIVSTGPRRHDRRQAIRQTWWQECKPTKMVGILKNLSQVQGVVNVWKILRRSCFVPPFSALIYFTLNSRKGCRAFSVNVNNDCSITLHPPFQSKTSVMLRNLGQT